MELVPNQEVILYGEEDSLTFAVACEAVKQLSVIGVCVDSFFGVDSSFMAHLPRIAFDEMKNYPEAVVVVTDGALPDETRCRIEGMGVRCTLLKELSLAHREEHAPEVEVDIMPEVEVDIMPEAETEVMPEAEPMDETETEPLSETISETWAECDSVRELEQEEPEKDPLPVSHLSEEQFAAFRNDVNRYYTEIIKAIWDTKAKDMSIYNINKELQKFKDGYYWKILDPIISDLITLREDCKKSASDLEQYHLTQKKQCNHMQCTVEQIENLLIVQDVVENCGIYSFNGKVFYPAVEDTKLYDLDVKTEVEIPAPELIGSLPEMSDHSPDAIMDFLPAAQARIEQLLQASDGLLRTISLQAEEAKKQQKICDGLLLTPLFIRIIQLNDMMEKKLRALELSDEDTAPQIYERAYRFAVDYLENLLLSYGVKIRSFIDDGFDPKYQRALKIVKISADEAEKDKKVAQYFTDCYIVDEKVIAPAKVAVYRS